MSERFMKAVDGTLNNEVSVTENGAVGYATSGKKLLDCNFKLSSMRNMTDKEIVDLFAKAFAEDKDLAVRWLFFARDRVEGCGERRTFRVCLKWLADMEPDAVRNLIKLVPEYGRMDDVWSVLFDTGLKDDVVEFVAAQLKTDNENLAAGKAVSLCAKWLPSVNTSSPKTRDLARRLRRELGLSEKDYRKMLSALRAKIAIVETMISDKSGEGWSKVDYEHVPSLANVKYRNAFLRHDETRRRAFLGALEKGEAKINASMSTPVDVVHAYGGGYGRSSEDQTLEAMWKALVDKNAGQLDNTLVVVDGSGSMSAPVGNTRLTCHDVANGLGLYFADVSSGYYNGRFMTFGAKPQLVDVTGCRNLRQKIDLVYRYNDCSNTNIALVFRTLLKSAVSSNVKQDEMPKNILIVSDMEFDGGCYFADTQPSQAVSGYMWGRPSGTLDYDADKLSLFQKLKREYEDAGYQMPRLVFWNVCSRTGTIPLQNNNLGVALVSGFSPAILDMVMSGELDPFKLLVEKLSKPRYDAVSKAAGLK